MSFAGRKRKLYIASVLLALLGVLCGIVPYALMGSMANNLIEGNREWNFYLTRGLIMAACWVGKIVGHNISTTCSHVATFHVLGEIRKQHGFQRPCARVNKSIANNTNAATNPAKNPYTIPLGTQFL